LFARVRRFLGFRRCDVGVPSDWFEEPPDAYVREPRRPRPSRPGGVVMLELPDADI
jgi:hypothetical protein